MTEPVQKKVDLDAVLDLFRNSMNCAQTVLSTFGPQLGVDAAICRRVACGFGSGMAVMQKECGAVTGAYMVIGLKYGSFQKGDEASKKNTYRIQKLFNEQFIKNNKSLMCNELLGADIRTEAGLLAARQQNLFATKCWPLVKDAILILQNLL
jgi:C_GCAxxG_C_C family probable redox protein